MFNKKLLNKQMKVMGLVTAVPSLPFNENPGINAQVKKMTFTMLSKRQGLILDKILS